MMKLLRTRWGTILLATIVGASLGVTIASDAVEGVAFDLYDRFNPVVTADARVLGTVDDGVVIAMSGTKHRACEFSPPPRAFGTALNGERVELGMVRIDKPETGATRPLGPFNAGIWRIWPRAGILSFQVYVRHVCNGRVVATMAADVKVP